MRALSRLLLLAGSAYTTADAATVQEVDPASSAPASVPTVLVSAAHPRQREKEVRIVFEVSENAVQGADAFGPKDVLVVDDKGRRLKITKWSRKLASSADLDDRYYGGLYRLPPTSGAHSVRYIGYVVGPTNGYIEASVPARAVCAKATDGSTEPLCSEESNSVRVYIDPATSTSCTSVKLPTTSVELGPTETTVPVTFSFPSVVASSSFSASSVRAYAFNILGPVLPAVELPLVRVTRVDSSSYSAELDLAGVDPRLDYVEVFVTEDVVGEDGVSFWYGSARACVCCV
jgi:hypothetical protein